MDFLMFLLVIFLVIGPLAGYQSTRNRRLQQGPQTPQLYGAGPFQGAQQYGQPMGYGQSQQQPVTAEAFKASKAALADDITTYGTELRDLDLDVVGRELSSEAQDDYTRALDAYDGAKATLERTQYVDDLKRVAEILEEGRFSVASVKARVAGKPVPQRRPPCFFDPAHGPSVDDVLWTPAGGTARKVPACAHDVQRIQLGADPSIRMVAYQGQMQPYWENQAYAPYAQGYYGRYGMDPTMQSLAQSAIVFGGLGLLFGMFGD